MMRYIFEETNYNFAFKIIKTDKNHTIKIGIVDMMGPFWDENLIRPLYEKYGEEGRKYAADMYMDLPLEIHTLMRWGWG